LHTAAKHDNTEVVRVLLEHGANVDVVDSQGRTPFQIASAKKYEYYGIVNVL